MFYQTVIIRDTQRGLLFRDGTLMHVLKPGKHRFFKRPGLQQYVEIVDILKAEVREDHATLVNTRFPDVADTLMEEVETGADQIAIVYQDGQPATLVPPWSRRFFWKLLNDVRSEVIDVQTGNIITKEQWKAVRPFANNRLIASFQVPQSHVGMLYINGKLHSRLEPGDHRFWVTDGTVTTQTLDLRPAQMEITAQEILTKDRVSLRVTLTAFTTITDPETVLESSTDHEAFIYRLVQFAVREAVGGRSLDEVLNEREKVDEQIRAYVTDHIRNVGVQLNEISIKDVILPGDMRELLNRVVEAEKMAQANLIRRREETAATRSLLNTARLMDDNPTLMRLKELEALEKLTEKVGKIDLHTGDRGAFDALLSGLLKTGAKDDKA